MGRESRRREEAVIPWPSSRTVSVRASALTADQQERRGGERGTRDGRDQLHGRGGLVDPGRAREHLALPEHLEKHGERVSVTVTDQKRYEKTKSHC